VFYGLYGYGATHTVAFKDITVEGCEVEIDIDVKPGSDPNSINLGSRGLIPVAILSSDSFDALQVDPDTVELDGAGVAVRGKAEKLLAQEEDVNGDGLIDLLLHVETENFAPDVQSGQAILTGFTYDGNPIHGLDAIVVVPPQPAPEPCSLAALALGGVVLLRRRRR
jgi:hypothetical protein